MTPMFSELRNAIVDVPDEDSTLVQVDRAELASLLSWVDAESTRITKAVGEEREGCMDAIRALIFIPSLDDLKPGDIENAERCVVAARTAIRARDVGLVETLLDGSKIRKLLEEGRDLRRVFDERTIRLRNLPTPPFTVDTLPKDPGGSR